MPETPSASQTIGPFFHPALIQDDMRRIPVPGASGEELTLAGRVLDGNGQAVSDAMLELWHPSSGFARAATDAQGRFAVALPRPEADRPGTAAYFAVAVFARGLLRQLHTRCYLPDQAALDTDPVLASIDPERRATLVARVQDGGLGFDVVLQGAGETVFFAL